MIWGLLGVLGVALAGTILALQWAWHLHEEETTERAQMQRRLSELEARFMVTRATLHGIQAALDDFTAEEIDLDEVRRNQAAIKEALGE